MKSYMLLQARESIMNCFLAVFEAHSVLADHSMTPTSSDLAPLSYRSQTVQDVMHVPC